MSPDYPLKLATLRFLKSIYFLMLLQVAFLHYQEEMLQYVGELVLSFQSLPTFVNLWIVTTVERLLVLFSLVLNFYVCLLFVKTWNWPHKQKKVDDELVAKIQKFITEHSKTLSEDDLDRDSNADAPSWNIPQPGQKCTTSADDKANLEQTRSLSGECAICMYQYTTGDRIAWSSNPNCIHCYHSQCVQSWLMPWEERNQLCPCCRQSYCTASTAESF